MPRDRSRSPAVNLDRLSRVLASFARYADKRPAGLRVDENGTMLVSNVVETISASLHHVTSSDVLKAVSASMFRREGYNEVSSRWNVAEEASGEWSITFKERKDANPRARGSAAGAGHFPRRHDANRGAYERYSPRDRPGPMGLESKLDSSLEELIHQRDDPYRARGRSLPANLPRPDRAESSDFAERAARTRRATEQMGLTPGTSHCRLARSVDEGGREDSFDFRNRDRGGCRDRGDRGYRDRGGFRDDRRGGYGRAPRGERTPTEALSRWLSWVLRSGHAECGIRIEEGWISIQAAARARNAPAEEVYRLLRQDPDGRWEFGGLAHQGSVRKVPRGMRQRQARSDLPLQPREATGEVPLHGVARGRSRSRSPGGSARLLGGLRSRSRSSEYDGMNGSDDDALAERARNLHVSGEVEQLSAAEAEAAMRSSQAEEAPAPPGPPESDEAQPSGYPQPPPGEHWTAYKEETGGGDSFWWYYDGPKGKFMALSDNKVQPYPEDA